MSFSAADLAAIKAAVTADATALGYWTAGNPGECCAYLNAPSPTPVLIWRPDIPVAELLTGVVWSAFVSLTPQVQAAWAALTAGGTVDSTNDNVRAGFVTVFGTGSQTVTNLAAIAQRPASRLEAIFTAAGVSAQYGTTIQVADLIGAMA